MSPQYLLEVFRDTYGAAHHRVSHPQTCRRGGQGPILLRTKALSRGPLSRLQRLADACCATRKKQYLRWPTDASNHAAV